MDTIHTYKELLGTNFSIKFTDLTLDLELIEVSSVTADVTEGGQSEPFSLVFRTEIEEAMEQGTYELNHDSAGDKVLFLVPIGPDDVGMRYEAVFT